MPAAGHRHRDGVSEIDFKCFAVGVHDIHAFRQVFQRQRVGKRGGNYPPGDVGNGNRSGAVQADCGVVKSDAVGCCHAGSGYLYRAFGAGACSAEIAQLYAVGMFPIRESGVAVSCRSAGDGVAG